MFRVFVGDQIEQGITQTDNDDNKNVSYDKNNDKQKYYLNKSLNKYFHDDLRKNIFSFVYENYFFISSNLSIIIIHLLSYISSIISSLFIKFHLLPSYTYAYGLFILDIYTFVFSGLSLLKWINSINIGIIELNFLNYWLQNNSGNNGIMGQINELVQNANDTRVANKKILVDILTNIYSMAYLDLLNAQNAEAYKVYAKYGNPRNNKYYTQYLDT